ncbi:aldehyde dehydrogenase family protein [Streptomyces spinosisporus]|uniref:Aldehyde dehydrogenase family protein n=1 Tax=Streptomyces spinosisporus TaxID=2927582 RepID=A0ABS9XDF6_9ACTN|nr:aldehyde dehydrogenase family protein [Streptomyces spinosisporus]MCI3240109.1 aldehyde dehydrogenase family protein [Streptomyces spinosisporus]
MSTTDGAPLSAHVDAITDAGEYLARSSKPLRLPDGREIGAISEVPRLYVTRAFARLAHAPVLPYATRLEMLAKAADLFENAVLEGQSIDDYLDLVGLCAGVPRAVAQASIAAIARTLRALPDTLAQEIPRGAVTSLDDPRVREGAAYWARQGRTLAVLASGNTPGVHGLWPSALALGYAVAVRPSSREPFTPQRLVRAFREAGFTSHVALLPTDHEVADVLVEQADRALVYGGQSVVDKYAADPAVLTQGPGRSKTVITDDVDWRAHLDTVAASVAGLGGVACTCTTAVLVEGDRARAEEFGAALAERLAESEAGEHRTELPLVTARQLAQYVERVGQGTTAHGRTDIVETVAPDTAVLHPVVRVAADAKAPVLGVELPFPCVWIAPFSRADGIAPLVGSLVVAAITEDMEFAQRLLDEPGIANVYVGAHTTTWMKAGVPHDGYLSEHLMRTKGVIR